MPNNPRAVDNLIPAKKGEVRNPNGKPKGTKHINTWIQNLLTDEDFKIKILDGYEFKEYKGAPLKAILEAQVRLALNSKDENTRIKATELLLKHGWTQKSEQEQSGTVTIVTRKYNAKSDD